MSRICCRWASVGGIRRLLTKAVVITAFVVAACGTRTPPGQSSLPTGRAILNTTTVAELVVAFTKAGLPVQNAHDVAQSRCPQIRCIDAVDSDTVSIIKFGSTGAAQRFAGSTPDMYQIEDVVLVFTPSVPADQKAAYQSIARSAVTS
jgi:predicted small secreted protein